MIRTYRIEFDNVADKRQWKQWQTHLGYLNPDNQPRPKKRKVRRDRFTYHQDDLFGTDFSEMLGVRQ